ncbi:hypothetical protein J2T10_002387 [Paenarthrobacter nicotinovorans]|jgi:hypothetical protein|uniref:Uncharacterized protein n=1 Tax=Paenarthrobacter nicotinovorans TaxID=29320 RepID=A0ABT9TND2_PAENI|nr:hypothetical protein [Paenarthrobacter nicotinovorans]MDQ0102734.1 hypothetical protein [Paenarthrobacter nicotinovorans]
MGTAIDSFDVAGRSTIRSGDGAFFHLPPSAGGGQHLATGVSDELLQRRQAGALPLPGRELIGLVAPEPVAAALLPVFHEAGVDLAVGDDREPGSVGLLLHLATMPAERNRFDALPGRAAVLRFYGEGDLVFVDPLSLEPADPTGWQVLRRRLAASPAAAELRAWLDTPAAAADFALQGIAMDLLTARLLTIITAWQRNSPSLAAHRRTLWRLDTLTLANSEHPVLPFPEPASLGEGLRAPLR